MGHCPICSLAQTVHCFCVCFVSRHAMPPTELVVVSCQQNVYFRFNQGIDSLTFDKPVLGMRT